ncbi:MAG: outer membrane lipoprotein carrier protein LolA [Methylobacteriaceae bacterium]|nr:outer membrane lipoprotein carrier protein LolA [Methylobacteriaceae bacterium]
MPTRRIRWAAGLVLAAGGVAQAAPVVTVLPPRRPASLARPVEIVATGSVRPAPAPAAPLPILPVAGELAGANARSVVERANATLNGVKTLSAEFSQVGGDGRRSSGTLYLARPGKVRFEYDKPSTLEVVSDGSTVLVRDRKLNTADPYPIGQTPLKFLLSSRIDLARESTVTGVTSDRDGVTITVEDASTLGGTSRIALTFDPEVTTLKRWRVVDPQGYTTTVALSNIERNATIDPRVFMLNFMRPVE